MSHSSQLVYIYLNYRGTQQLTQNIRLIEIGIILFDSEQRPTFT
jgi:hypothetical protein